MEDFLIARLKANHSQNKPFGKLLKRFGKERNGMNNKELTVWLFAITMMASIVGLIVYGSIQNTKARTEATVAKAQEHTKRAEGRHQLLDFLGLVKQ